MKRFVALLVLLTLITGIFNLTGCARKIRAENLMDGVEGDKVEKINVDDMFSYSQMELSLKILEKLASSGGENIMISPMSISVALAMVSNGASGQSLSQIEALIGGNVDDLNAYYYSFVQDLSNNDDSKLYLKNSVWIRDIQKLHVQDSFLRKNATYYGADIFKAPFNSSTVDDINLWVNKNTDGMINKMIDEIDDDMMLYLINTVTFDAKWNTQYEKADIYDGDFTNSIGKIVKTEMLHSEESGYIELENAVGTLKKYSGGKYAFVALLPDENTTPEALISSLDGQTLVNAIKERSEVTVRLTLPSFKNDYSSELSETLISLGITDAFDPDVIGDFDNMATVDDGDLCIGNVLHKTHITVNAEGTKAAGATQVGISNCTSANPSSFKNVCLDRPFVYMIIDVQTALPLFIGIQNDV